ncbi:hypothetical protein MRB53_028695 [Persea americana]|uniref:Uncharacterized protein n=1 Tax=Persea americana TaxID=3435 RepID=A0ACC2KGN0_PERAE|nr:hypothetical protein MRB53_028695 [Persea americana]
MLGVEENGVWLDWIVMRFSVLFLTRLARLRKITSHDLELGLSSLALAISQPLNSQSSLCEKFGDFLVSMRSLSVFLLPLAQIRTWNPSEGNNLSAEGFGYQ